VASFWGKKKGEPNRERVEAENQQTTNYGVREKRKRRNPALFDQKKAWKKVRNGKGDRDFFSTEKKETPM